MNVKSIVFTKAHLTAPFAVPPKSAPFTTREKLCSVAISLFIGLLTLGIGGVATFYLMTAKMKANKVLDPQKKAVHFGGARAREFDCEEAPKKVAQVNSIVLV